jgi:hypothetical protein
MDLPTRLRDVSGRIRLLALTAGLLAAFAPSASAAGWLPAQNLTDPATAHDVSSTATASDAAGESFVTWVASDGTNDRVWLATHTPGTGWSTPVALSEAGTNASAPSIAVGPNGFGALGWTRADGSVEVARRSPGGAFGAPAVVSLGGTNSQVNVAVDTAGDVEVAYEETTGLIVRARRYTQAAGTWSSVADLFTAVSPSNQLMLGVTMVMSPAGVATVAWTVDTDTSTTTSLNVLSRSQDATGTSWLGVVSNSTTTNPTWSARAQLAVSDDGTVTLVWMEYTTSGCGFLCVTFATSVVRSETRSPTGTWSAVQTLSNPATVSDNPTVAMSPAGETTVVWVEGAANAVKALTRTVGGGFPVASAAVIISPQDRAIQSGNFLGIPISSVHVAESATGTVVLFDRTDGTNEIAQAVYRPAGGLWPNPVLTPPTALSAPGADAGFDGFVASFDAVGDIVVSWDRGQALQVATYDASSPAFTAVSVPATGTAGQPIGMSAATTDAWGSLAANQPSWSFGDGGTGAGAAVTHVFATPGTYTVTTGAVDTAGNGATPSTHTITITSPPLPPLPPLPRTTVTAPRPSYSWQGGKLHGSVTIGGTVGGAASLTVTIAAHAGGKTVAKATFSASAGAWSRAFKLPATLLPGTYDVAVAGAAVQPSSTSFTLTAPATGIVSRSYASATHGGPAAASVGATTQLWAHFRFAVLAKKGQKITTQWILPSGTKLGAVTRPRGSVVEAQVKDLRGTKLPKGRWRCVLRVGKTVLATLNVRLK